MMRFSKELLKELVYEHTATGADGIPLTIVENTIIGTGRWSIHHRVVFQYADKFYAATYSEGATEQQDERPFEYDAPMVMCVEVVPTSKTVITYEVPNYQHGEQSAGTRSKAI